MPSDSIDQLIAAWDDRLKRIDDNLLALEAEPTYQILAGTRGERAPLEGVTRARVEPALDALADLFENRARLTEVLERAKAIRREFSALWGNDERAASIRKLLDGPSIKLGARPTPLARRSLLDAPAEEVAIVPDQLLVAMVQAFERARDAVLAVAAAWAHLEPAISRAEEEAAAVRRAAEMLGEAVHDEGEFLTFERELALLRTRVARDPLGARDVLDGPIVPAIAAVRARIEAQSRSRDHALVMFARAIELRRAIYDVGAEAERARERIAREFTNEPLGDHVSPELIEGLDVWRAKIEGTARAGRWSSAEVGLTRWLETAEEYLAIERAIASAPEALAARRIELQGRLGARRAQLAALARRGVSIDGDAASLADTADEILRRVPTPLDLATIAVEAFERKIIDAQRSSSPVQ